MTLILSNALVNTEHFHSIYMDGASILVLEGSVASVAIRNVPSDALSKIAVATAEGKSYVEFENAELDIREAEDDS